MPCARNVATTFLLIAATRLDADPLHPMSAQPRQQGEMAVRVVVDLQALLAPIQGDVELALAGIDAGTDHGILSHLPRPSLECEPSVPSTMRAR